MKSREYLASNAMEMDARGKLPSEWLEEPERLLARLALELGTPLL
jgi:hypothetical protein